mmetsp:Transcript_20978/g.24274  ORF Transcript_20978/g.24274 Transcript_20978/m.24274 type:complete len:102 (-) Transcript_20978:434-739(-)
MNPNKSIEVNRSFNFSQHSRIHQEKGNPPSLVSYLSKQKLEPIPLLKQRIPRYSNNDFLSTSQAVSSTQQLLSIQTENIDPPMILKQERSSSQYKLTPRKK